MSRKRISLVLPKPQVEHALFSVWYKISFFGIHMSNSLILFCYIVHFLQLILYEEAVRWIMQVTRLFADSEKYKKMDFLYRWFAWLISKKKNKQMEEKNTKEKRKFKQLALWEKIVRQDWNGVTFEICFFFLTNDN